jgi:hypothetical protein
MMKQAVFVRQAPAKGKEKTKAAGASGAKTG